MHRRLTPGLLIFFIFLTTLTACDLNNSDAPPPAPESISLRAEANREAVAIIRDGEREPLSLVQQTTISDSDGLAVEADGRATLSVDDLLTVELLRGAQVEIKSALRTPQMADLVLQKEGGLLFAEFNPDRLADHTFAVQTPLATITTGGARFLVSRGVDNLEWIVNLGPADDQLEVAAMDNVQPVPGGTARWVAPDGAISDSLPLDTAQVNDWFDAVQNGSPPTALAEAILPPADVLASTASLAVLPQLGQPFELGPDSGQGTVKLTLDPIGLFGAPTYTLEDCDEDGSQDLAILAGRVHFDFSDLLARTSALDVTAINRDLPGNGALWATAITGEEVARQLFDVSGGGRQVLSLRATQPYRTAELAMIDGCFVGFSLTPPTPAGTPAQPRVVSSPGQPAAPQQSTVVNILADDEPDETEAESDVVPTVTGQQRSAGPITAWAAGGTVISIDGSLNDWNLLVQENQAAWTRFSAVTYDGACAVRFESGTTATDLSGQVLFAYDEQFLYVAFQVEDDGFVPYGGGDQEYFLGDSPQLSLDMELLSDYEDTSRSRDDWQIDFYPDPAAPTAMLWQLGSLSARRFEEAEVAAASSATGYVVEAALPWRSLGANPQPGDRLGLAANINDNDTPGTDAQECIISTAPQRTWNDPTTWGTLFLRPSR